MHEHEHEHEEGETHNEWQELLDFVQGKQIVGVAVSDDEADFDLIFEDGSRLELYAMMADEEDVVEAYIDWALTEPGDEDDEDADFSGNGAGDE